MTDIIDPDTTDPDQADSEGGECDVQAIRDRVDEMVGTSAHDEVSSADLVQAWRTALAPGRPALADAQKPLDDPRLQELFSSAIDGALAFGAQGSNPPPPGHWLQRFWDAGRTEAQKQAALANTPDRQALADALAHMTELRADALDLSREERDRAERLAEALRQCEGALYAAYDGIDNAAIRKLVEGAMDAASAALAAEAQPADAEPVAFIGDYLLKCLDKGWSDSCTVHREARMVEADEGAAVALYTAPQAEPAREPSDPELLTLWATAREKGGLTIAASLDFARAVRAWKRPREAAMSDDIRAAEAADWRQVAANGGPPCFHLTGRRFCLRAEGWGGHGCMHRFVSLADLLTEKEHVADMLAAEAQPPEAEPVAWLYECEHPGGRMKYASVDSDDRRHLHPPFLKWERVTKTPLYAAPQPEPAREPSPEEIDDVWDTEANGYGGGIPSWRIHAFARAMRAWPGKPPEGGRDGR